MKKAIVAGHICLDITPVFPQKQYADIASVLKPGKLVQMKDVDVHTGGAVANTGLAMKILGADVELMGKIGDDSFGDMILNILKKYDAHKGMIRITGEATSYSVVLAIPGMDRIFLHNPGANDTFTAADVIESQLLNLARSSSNISLFHFGYPPIMHGMFSNDGEELVKLFKWFKSQNIATSLDMTQIDPDTEAGRADWKLILKKVLPYVDFFMPSVEELAYMIDKDAFSKMQSNSKCDDVTRSLDPDNDIRPLALKCIEYGAKVVIVKSGAPGMYYAVTPDRDALHELDRIFAFDGCDLKSGFNAEQFAGKSGFERSFKPSKVVSATGAGDVSIAGFLTSILNGDSFEDCIKMALAAGAASVEAVDALGGLMTMKELKQKIDNGWERN